MSRFRPPLSSLAYPAVLRSAPMAPYRPSVSKPAPVAIQWQAPQKKDSRWITERVQQNPFHRFVFFCALALTFVQMTFIHELISTIFNVRSFLPPLFGSLAIIGLIVTGGMRRVFHAQAAYWVVAFAIWVALGIPFSSWKGGSLDVILPYFRTQLAQFFILAGLVTTWKEFRLILYTVAISGMVNEVTALWMSRGGGRLDIADSVPSIGNSNDFAAHLLFLLPLTLFMFYNKDVPRIFRFVTLGSVVYGLFLIVSTASRGAAVALALGYLFILFRSHGWNRFVLALTVPLTFFILLVAMPASVGQRLSTMLGGDEAKEAVELADARTHLFNKSLEFTWKNPIFGVGLGQFSTAEGLASKKEGQHGVWKDTHNSYTQISSETGIPALIFFLGALVSGYVLVSRIYRQAQVQGHALIEKAAFSLMLSFVCFGASAFFLSLAYHFYFPDLMGLAVALALIAKVEFNKQAPAAQRVSSHPPM